ncbi:hypothetical protein [Roseisalinus antarcticus]|nr:hypothetical protein [Roseisalinus antarcticus]
MDAVVIGISVAGLGYVGSGFMKARKRGRAAKADQSLAAGRDAEVDLGVVAETPAAATALPEDVLPLRRRPRADGAGPREIVAEDAADLQAGIGEPEFDLDAAGPLPPAGEAPVAAGTQPLDIMIVCDDRGLTEVETVELQMPDDVLTLEFEEDPMGHLHLVHGRASAEVEGGQAQSAWLDVYLSRADWLGLHDLDSNGEFRPRDATHVLRINLGSLLARPDGSVVGALNEDPEIYFDREIASETEFTV